MFRIFIKYAGQVYFSRSTHVFIHVIHTWNPSKLSIYVCSMDVASYMMSISVN